MAEKRNVSEVSICVALKDIKEVIIRFHDVAANNYWKQQSFYCEYLKHNDGEKDLSKVDGKYNQNLYRN